MALKRFVKFNIDVSSSGEHPIEWYLDDEGNELDEDTIGDILDEQMIELVEEDQWATWDLDFKIVEREEDE